MRISYHQRRLLTVPLFAVALFLNGCSMVSYYSQSIEGQLSILYHREEIDQVINDPSQGESLKKKLQQVKKIRHYASESLFLPNNKSYLYYTDLHRPYVVWNVFAAPEFSLVPLSWCYPIVGCVSYRGYFDESNATNHALQLSSAGNDTVVAGIAAYSTLGWFNDPVLSSMIHWHERALAGLIFHELSHQVVYIPDETGFNEAFASAVERIGSIQWLIQHKPKHVDRYLAYLNAQNDFRNLLRTTRNTLSALYDGNATEEDKREKKGAIILKLKLDYAELKQNWPKGIHFDSWFKTPINNARFTSSMTYLQKIPAFYALFVETNGEWPRFFKLVKSLQDLDKEMRNEFINKRLSNNFDLKKITLLLYQKSSSGKSIEHSVSMHPHRETDK